MGFVGADPEVRVTQLGKEIVTFSLGINRRRKDHKTGKFKDEASWHKISILNSGLVNVAKSYLKKGSRVFISGELRNSKWVDDKAIERFSTEIILGDNGILQFENKLAEGEIEEVVRKPRARKSYRK